jgi:hypothetical protein
MKIIDIEDEEDRKIAEEAYQEYVDSNYISHPIEELWKELIKNRSLTR